MMTQFQKKKRTICKIDYWSNKYIWKKHRDSEKEKKREEFQNIKTSGTRMLILISFFFTFFIFPKKMITKKLLWVRLCSFQPTDIYACVCTCVCTCARVERRF